MTTGVHQTLGRMSPMSNHYWYRKRREVANLLSRHVHHADRIVDLGAGVGKDLALLASLFPSAEILAIDGSRESVEEINARFSENSRVRGELGDLRERLPLEDATFDLGYCSEVLEHMPEPAVLLAEACRIIKPGGFLLVTTPNEPNVFQKNFWRKGKADAPHVSQNGDAELFGHISLGTVKEWDAALARAGFELVDFARGAIMYGGREWLDREGVLAAFFAAEAIFDRAPRKLGRSLSDQVIGLYRRP